MWCKLSFFVYGIGEVWGGELLVMYLVMLV